MGWEDPEEARAQADYALGYDEDGRWEMGALPLLLPLVSLGPLIAERIRRARERSQLVRAESQRRGVHPSVVRRELRERRRAERSATITSPPPRAVAPAGRPLLWRRLSRRRDAVAGGVMPRGRRLRRRMRRLRRRMRRRGLMMPGPRMYPGAARCVMMRGDDGQLLAVDEYGNAAEIVGMDAELEGDYGDDEDYGDDDLEGDEDFGDDEDYGDDEDLGEDLEGEEDDEDDELMGEAEEAAADLEGALQADEETFGASEKRLERRIERIAAKIERIREKPLRGMFKRRKQRRRARRISRLRAKQRRLQAKLRRIRGVRRQNLAAIAGTAAGVGAAQGLGMALFSRQGQEAPRVQQASKLYDPQYAHNVRVQAARAGQVGRFVSPPGSGRLNRVPMFALGRPNNPRNALVVPATLITAGTDLATEDLPYVLVKMVGFVASTAGTADDNNAIGLVEDLKIRGGTNLFLHEGPANADDYNTAHDDQLVGLRSYPNIRSPNQAFVTVKATGDLDDVVIITASVVVDILEDDTYGAGFAGAYAG